MKTPKKRPSKFVLSYLPAIFLFRGARRRAVESNFLIQETMSKKKLSKKRTVNKQLVSCAVTIKVVPNRRTAIVILSFMGLRLAEIVFEAIFEQPVKDLLSVVMNWIKSILA